MSGTQRPTVGAGALVAGMGAALALAVFFRPEALKVPAWVAYVAALAFVLAGWTVIARARGNRMLQAWLPVALLACMAAIPTWLAFGPGTRRCTVSVTRWMVTLLGRHTDLACRIGFGVAAVVGIGLVLLAAAQALRSTRAAGTET